jgi:hypothetical protein
VSAAVGFGRRLLQHRGAYRLADIGRHAAADAKFQPLQIGYGRITGLARTLLYTRQDARNS